MIRNRGRWNDGIILDVAFMLILAAEEQVGGRDRQPG